MYITKLNKNVDFLWQRPKQKIKDLNKEWYDPVPVGGDPLNSTMKNISKKANLSVEYTNHCIRATVVTKLNEKGFEARDIMATTGHKSESSIRSYATKCPPKKRRMMSDALASPLVGNQEEEIPKKKVKDTVASPLTENPHIDTIDINIQNSEPEGPIFNIIDSFPDDDMSNDEIIQVLTQIENENKDLVPAENNTEKNVALTMPDQNQGKTFNFSTISNVANVNRHPLMPTMYFPNSNVMINYNFTAPK